METRMMDKNNCFNSLQTGKCIQRTVTAHRLKFGATKVSIPFKRESVFKGLERPFFGTPAPAFQFPSNGKVYSKFSISLINLDPFGFNSLQTGKCIQSKGGKYDDDETVS